MTAYVDPFARADTASGAGLGSIPSGPAWLQLSGSWRISSNKAVTDTPQASSPIAVADLGLADLTELSLSVSSGGGDALYFRVVDASNWWRLRVEHTTSSQAYYSTEYLWTATYGFQGVGGTLSAWGSSPSSDPTPPIKDGSYEKISSSWTGSTRQVFAGSVTTDTYRAILDKCVAGVVTQKASAAVASTLDGLKIVAAGATITASYRSSATWTAIATVIDSSLVAATKHGIGRAPSEQSGTALDAFVATTADSAPNAPTLVYPTGGVVIDSTTVQRFRDLFSDPDAGDTQSAHEYRYRLVADAAWTTLTETTPNQFHDFPPGTFADGAWEWQARSYDAAGQVGPWSSSATFTAATPADQPTITSPINGGTISTDEALVTWSSDPYTHYRVRVLADDAGVPDTGDVLYDSGELLTTGAASHLTPFPTNNITVHVQVEVKIAGLWTSWASVQDDVAFTPPRRPLISVSAGALDIAVFVTNEDPGDDYPDVTSNELWRRPLGDTGDGFRIAIGIPVDGGFVDTHAGHLEDVEYRWRAMGDNGTTRWGRWSAAEPEPTISTFDDLAAAFATFDAVADNYATFNEILGS